MHTNLHIHVHMYSLQETYTHTVPVYVQKLDKLELADSISRNHFKGFCWCVAEQFNPIGKLVSAGQQKLTLECCLTMYSPRVAITLDCITMWAHKEPL